MWASSLLERLWAAGPVLLPVLLDAAIKGVAILALTALAALGMRRASAAARHLVWFLGVLSLLALPILSATLPGWYILPSWMVSAPVAIQPTPAPIPAPAPGLAVAPAPIPGVVIAPAPPDTTILPNHAPPELAATPLPAPAPIAAMPSPPPAPLPMPVPWQAWALLAWLVGSVLLLGKVALGFMSLWWLGRKSSRITGGSWAVLLRPLCSRLRLRRPVELLSSPRRTMPMTWGLWRTRLLLPEEAATWTTDQRRTVLLHELAHAKRWDCLTQLFTQLACALYWFNPLVWVAWRRMQTERERACDDLVLSTGAKASAYAAQLLQMAAQMPPVRLGAAAIAMARPSRLEGRLLAILDVGRNRRTLTWGAGFLAVALIGALAVPLAMVRAQDQKAARDEAALPQKSQPATRLAADKASEFYYIAGVPRSGVYTLSGQRITLLQAATAGGWQGDKDIAQTIRLIRRSNEAVTIRVLRLRDLMTKPEGDVLVEAGDTLMVGNDLDAPPATQPATGKASSEQNYYVGGSVPRSGVYALSGQPTVLQAAIAAGWQADKGASQTIRLIRSSNGAATTRVLRLGDLMTKPENDVQVKAGDTLMVGDNLEATPATQPEKLKALLPSGAEIELLAVSGYPDKDRPWWRPDGTRLDDPPIDPSVLDITSFIDPKVRKMEFVFRLGQKAAEPGYESWIVRSDGGGAWGTGRHAKKGVPVPDLKVIGVSMPADATTLSMDLWVAAGPWETVATSDGLQPQGPLGAAGEAPNSSDPTTLITARFANKQDAQVVAIDRDGVSHVGRPAGIRNAGGHADADFLFSRLAPARFKSFTLQTRPCELIHLKDISLAPGQQTDARLTAAAPAPGVPTTRPAAGAALDEAEPNQNVETRVYDLRDLLAEAQIKDFAAPPIWSAATTQPGGDDAGQGTEGTGPSREELVQQIIKVIQETAGTPESWKAGGGGRIQEFSGNLVIRQTPQVHLEIMKLLGQLRETRGNKISIESRFARVSDEQDAQWRETFKEDLKDKTKAAPGSDSWFVDDLAAQRLVQGFGALKPGGAVVAAPRLMLFNGKRAFVSVGQQVTLLLPRKDAEGSAVPMTFLEGATLEVSPAMSADRKYVTLEMLPSVSKLLDRADADQPRFGLAAMRTVVSIPDRGTLLVRLPSVESRATGVKEVMDKASGKKSYEVVTVPVKDPAKKPEWVYLLVKPTIIVKPDGGKDDLFPGLLPPGRPAATTRPGNAGKETGSAATRPGG